MTLFIQVCKNCPEGIEGGYDPVFNKPTPFLGIE